VAEEEVIRGDQKRVSDRHGCLARSAPGSETTILCRRVTARLARGGSNRFGERPTQELARRPAGCLVGSKAAVAPAAVKAGRQGIWTSMSRDQPHPRGVRVELLTTPRPDPRDAAPSTPTIRMAAAHRPARRDHLSMRG
jgi:hypothetical protein